MPFPNIVCILPRAAFLVQWVGACHKTIVARGLPGRWRIRNLLPALLAALIQQALLCGPAFACAPVPLNEMFDRVIDEVQLTPELRQELFGMRAKVIALQARGDVEGARRLEEAAMAKLGYRKMWLRCGKGAFAWVPRTKPM